MFGSDNILKQMRMPGRQAPSAGDKFELDRSELFVDEDRPPSRTARLGIILIGGRGCPGAQVPPEAQNHPPLPLLPHALRGARSSSL